MDENNVPATSYNQMGTKFGKYQGKLQENFTKNQKSQKQKNLSTNVQRR